MSKVDRKLVGFYALVVAFVLVSVFAVAAVWAKAPPVAPNDELAADALHAWLGTTEPGLVSHIETRARQELEAGALRAPKERRVANVVLRRGVTGVGVQFLLAPRAIELSGLEAKCPVAPPGSPLTMITGLPEVAGTPARSLEEKVDRIVGRARFMFQQHAQMLAKSPGMERAAAEAREIATSHEFAVYRLEVVGTREALFALSTEPLVRLVVVDESANVATLDATRREFEKLGPAAFLPIPAKTFTISGGQSLATQ